MLFRYEAVGRGGDKITGTIDAGSQEAAINAIQRRGLVLSAIKAAEKGPLLHSQITLFNRVSQKDVVMLSRQMATLFTAQVSALRIFSLLAAENANRALAKHMAEIAEDLQGGDSISKALSKHPKVFSEFYVNMVRAGEESGKLDQTFNYLADYLDRTYETTSRVKHALVYPTFVALVFVGVMVFMLTSIIPQISEIIEGSGQDLPLYTKIVIGLSDFLRNYSFAILIAVALSAVGLYQYSKTESGAEVVSRFKLSIPYVGNLYRKLYLARIADNLNTMLSSAIPIIKALDTTARVVNDPTYSRVIRETSEEVRSGSTVSNAFATHKELPPILVQMVKIGEETGELGSILSTLAKFYSREVVAAVDTMISMIEPAMIILLALGVGFLLASVLVPIYNLSSSFG